MTVLVIGLLVGFAIGVALAALIVARGGTAGMLYVEAKTRHVVEHEHHHTFQVDAASPVPPAAIRPVHRKTTVPAVARPELERSRA